MITINILEKSDVVRADDWIRPLDFRSNGWSDEVLRFDSYSGRPSNHCRWVRVSDVLGECWFGKTSGHIQKKLNRPYEFARGSLPKWMVWDWRVEKDK